MTAYVPRSRRLGLRKKFDGPFEGIPPHLAPQLADWAEYLLHFMGEDRCKAIALQLRVPVGPHPYVSLMDAARDDDDVMWDVVEAILQAGDIEDYHQLLAEDENREHVCRMLDLAGSIYTINDDGLIMEKVGEEATATYAKATSVDDPISENLREAWANAYGRNPNASDAWDHAIKAIEALLHPIVEPNNTKATLGTMLKVLGNAPPEVRMRLPRAGPGPCRRQLGSHAQAGVGQS